MTTAAIVEPTTADRGIADSKQLSVGGSGGGRSSSGDVPSCTATDDGNKVSTGNGDSGNGIVSIGLINPKNPINVGSVQRACGCFNVTGEIRFTGNRYLYALRGQERAFEAAQSQGGGSKKKKKQKKTSSTDTKKHITSKIPLVHVNDILENIKPASSSAAADDVGGGGDDTTAGDTTAGDLACDSNANTTTMTKARNMHIVCIELVVGGATSLPFFEHPSNALYVFGPEDGSIPQSIIDISDSVVYIPTQTCMNLAATVNVVLYDRLCKEKLQQKTVTLKQQQKAGNSSEAAAAAAVHEDDEELIRTSRDNNNNLRIKVPNKKRRTS